MLAPTPASHSEVARRALLRRTWQAPFDAFEVDYSQPELRVVLTAGDQVLISGLWSWEASVNGRALSAAGAWEEVCWHSDRRADYLELELPLSGGWKVQRQMLLGRIDQFLLLADALVGNGAPPGDASAEIRHAFHLPLDLGASYRPAGETREGWLVAKRKHSARALPLALPEWRAGGFPGGGAWGGKQRGVRPAAGGRRPFSPPPP